MAKVNAGGLAAFMIDFVFVVMSDLKSKTDRQ